MIFVFDNVELDVDRVVLRRDGIDVPIESQVFDLLAFPVERRGHVVRKEELLDHVWGDRFVSESALTTHVHTGRPQRVDVERPVLRAADELQRWETSSAIDVVDLVGGT